MWKQRCRQSYAVVSRLGRFRKDRGACYVGPSLSNWSLRSLTSAIQIRVREATIPWELSGDWDYSGKRLFVRLSSHRPNIMDAGEPARDAVQRQPRRSVWGGLKMRTVWRRCVDCGVYFDNTLMHPDPRQRGVFGKPMFVCSDCTRRDRTATRNLRRLPTAGSNAPEADSATDLSYKGPRAFGRTASAIRKTGSFVGVEGGDAVLPLRSGPAPYRFDLRGLRGRSRLSDAATICRPIRSTSPEDAAAASPRSRRVRRSCARVPAASSPCGFR